MNRTAFEQTLVPEMDLIHHCDSPRALPPARRAQQRFDELIRLGLGLPRINLSYPSGPGVIVPHLAISCAQQWWLYLGPDEGFSARCIERLAEFVASHEALAAAVMLPAQLAYYDSPVLNAALVHVVGAEQERSWAFQVDPAAQEVGAPFELSHHSELLHALRAGVRGH